MVVVVDVLVTWMYPEGVGSPGTSTTTTISWENPLVEKGGAD